MGGKMVKSFKGSNKQYSIQGIIKSNIVINRGKYNNNKTKCTRLINTKFRTVLEEWEELVREVTGTTETEQ